MSQSTTTKTPFGEVLRFRATVTSSASPQALYDAIADVSSHLSWGGPGSASKGNALISLDAPAGLATTGTTFTSTGKAGKDTFHDRSTVVTATPGRRFTFTTEARLERQRKQAWLVTFTHDFQLSPAPGGSTLAYSCAVRPTNYLPYWLHPAMKPMTRLVMQRIIRRNIGTLARLAEAGR